jgi:hypothetical protein
MVEIALEITPAEVKAGLDRGEHIRLIDVREPEEHASRSAPILIQL